MLTDLCINFRTDSNFELADEGLAYLEELLVNAKLRKEHMEFTSRLRLPAEPVTQLEIGDILLHGLRCQNRTLLVRLLFNAAALDYIAELISGYVEELASTGNVEARAEREQ